MTGENRRGMVSSWAGCVATAAAVTVIAGATVAADNLATSAVDTTGIAAATSAADNSGSTAAYRRSVWCNMVD